MGEKDKKIGISFLKDIIKRRGPAYFAKIVEENRRLLEEHDKWKKGRKK